MSGPSYYPWLPEFGSFKTRFDAGEDDPDFKLWVFDGERYSCKVKGRLLECLSNGVRYRGWVITNWRNVAVCSSDIPESWKKSILS